MRLSIITIFIVLVGSVGCRHRPAVNNSTEYTTEQLIEANKRKVGTERGIIDDFVKRSGMNMQSSATGIRYIVYGHGTGDSAKSGQLATIAYEAYLLDSSLVASAKESAPFQFRIGESDAVSGLHEAITLLKEGDSARFVIPSYLAYGLTGNAPTIPPNAALYYDLRLLSVY